nr:MAG TPA: hypothetical protein [Caudoviricetes sp.]
MRGEIRSALVSEICQFLTSLPVLKPKWSRIWSRLFVAIPTFHLSMTSLPVLIILSRK